MAELNTHVNVKEKIYAVRSVVPNKSNNEIVLVLQQYDFNVDKAVQAFVDGSAIQVLKEWNMTGKKKNNKRKRSKSKQHQGNKDAKDKAERPEAGPLQPPPQIQNGHVNSCEKDSSSTDSAGEKSVLIPPEKAISTLEETSKALRGVTEGNRPLQQKLSLDGNPKPIHGTPERSEGLQWSAEQPCNPSKPKAKTSPVNSNAPAAHLEIKPDELAKKRGPNIEKSVKDLQRCTVSLTRYRVMIKEEVDSSVKKIKAAFAELHNCIIDKEVSLMAEMDKVKEEAMEILTARQKKAEELKRLTDLASQMAEMQLAELRAEIKHFVSERKYDEELGKAARFSCDIEQLKSQIMLCGEITHPKNNYSSRTPCSSLLPLLTAHTAASGKQSNFTRKLSNHNKPAEGKAANPKMVSNLPGTADLPHQALPPSKQNGSSSQRRRFNPQYHNRLNGSARLQGSGNDADPMAKGNNRHEHRRQPHNGFRPKNKGGNKNQEASLGTKIPEAPVHSEKPRRRQHATDNSEARPFRGNISRVSQCNLCPTRIEVSTDAAVLSVPAVTLVA
ncbi:SPATS2-like protein isoform X2 [Pteronotus mesoamericanus]|nr:SPATS2-like protein isoform X2 [Pteronotus parnellii mesoamericanus]XP_054441839.1 SPATS2-like protein isoform X2 [Pteronotus parnellii mesoamericanus]XP_054441841.1 SPATS2-like protein isoform X2 [Pteronotus parnellii mesoamericanus]XP_054441842.1 SPATS2-like protein isoform X2 [Pteronotus parnellii mesoamericanus]XP_054441843.1 SPATS2-like protein isoform X2 [Pteronotus parnellii mesoamericanus]XP_054441844.1 SPATS2-like protein isoform X2 [Pteronotus parnellii mesoamericanus]XP_05444184